MRKNFLKKLLEISFYVVIFIIVFSSILQKSVVSLDELWNFNTARAIMHGLIPYKEISMITTPFLPFISSIILKIFGDELLVFRIIAALLMTTIFYLAYKLSSKLSNSKVVGVIASLFLAYLYRNEYAIDYNYFVLMLMMIIEILQIKKMESDEEKNIYDAIIGITLGIAICTKQTIGIVITATTILSELMLVQDKETFKKYIKQTATKIIGIISVCAIFVIYLLVTNSFTDFIDYAILGIKSFTNKVSYFKLFNLKNKEIVALAKVMPVVLPLTMLMIFYGKISQLADQDKNYPFMKYMVVFISSLGMLITLYPIADEIHFMISIMLILIIYTSFTLGLINENVELDKSNISKFFLYTMYAYMILFLTYKLGVITYKKIDTYINEEKTETLAHIKYIPMTQEKIEYYEKLINYIEDARNSGYTVHILDADAVAVSILTDNYSKNYDMLLKGNIGVNGEKQIIEDIQNRTNTIYLLKNNESQLNWQSVTDVINYAKENLNKIDEIENYDVYTR